MIVYQLCRPAEGSAVPSLDTKSCPEGETTITRRRKHNQHANSKA